MACRNFSMNNATYMPPAYPGQTLWVRETWWASDPEVKARRPGCVMYRATSECEMPKWRPSIFMPKWASRIKLAVKDVRAERVREISIDDAFSEGCRAINDRERGEFRKLWNSINDKRGFGWDTNPWVWVVEFERAEVP